MPRNPNKARCTFPGCHNWAMRDQERCYVHRYPPGSNLPHPDPPPENSPSSEQGGPLAEACDSLPPSGAAPIQPSQGVSPAEPDFETQPAGPDPGILDGHIADLAAQLHRLHAHVCRLDAQLERDPALLPAYTRLLNLQGQLTSRLARLLRERQLIGETEHQDLMQQSIYDALDEAGKILGVQL